MGPLFESPPGPLWTCRPWTDMAPIPTLTQSHLYREGYLQQNNLEHLVMFFVKMLNSETVEELGTHQKTISRIPE